MALVRSPFILAPESKGLLSAAMTTLRLYSRLKIRIR